MAGKAAAYETSVLNILFAAVALATVFINHTTTPITNIAWGLHTADPVEADSQATSEAAYTSYARKDVARTAGGHSVSAGSMSPVADVDFITATGGSETETFGSVGIANAGATQIFYSGAVSPTIAVSSGVTPRLTTASTVTES